MAANKRKILENARKLAQKGSKDKALAEYQKLVKLDPKDTKLRLEIGDAYRRWGDADKAIEAYTKVADQYMRDGFDAKAVAVYKQILNLDPERSESYEPLAELYERMGLAAEAINALQTAADGYHKAGRRREALGLLRRMSSIDPTNTTSRIKVAELLRQEDMLPEAVSEYNEVADELSRQGDVEAAGRIYQRVLEIDPNRVETLVAFARNMLEQDKSAEAESVAKRVLAAEDQEPAHYELLADAYRAQNREDLLPEVYRSMADLYRQRGDEERAREILQRFVPPDSISLDTDGGDLDLGGSDYLDTGDGVPGNVSAALDAEDELSLDGGPFGDEMELGPELELGREDALDLGTPLDTGSDEEVDFASGAEATIMQATPLTPPPDAGPSKSIEDEVQPPPPSGDPDQLFAEASVYLRYGKRDRAIAHLEAILEQQPDHRAALEKLGEAHAEGGDDEQAVAYWLEAAKIAGDRGDAAAVTVLRGRIEALDPDAAATLASPEPEHEPEPEPEPVGHAGDASFDEVALDDIDIDIDVEDPELDEIEDEPVRAEAPPSGRAAARPVAPPEGERSSSASLSTTTAQQILEDLEEADFYMEQGLHGEAEEIYKRVLAIAPNHPKALVRLGEVSAARGEDPGASGAGRKPARQAPEPANEPEPLLVDDDALEFDSGVEEHVAARGDLSPDGPDPLTIEEPDTEDEIDLTAGLAGAEDDLDPLDDDAGMGAAAHGDAPPEEETGEFSVPTESFDGSRPRTEELPDADPGASFDLAAELSDVFDDADSSGDRSSDDSFAAVFEAFKRGVSETLSEADHEAHYDLGIAYKEMGLFDDAIQEFRSAMVHPPRVVECLHLIALCALDAGQTQLSVEHLEQLLETEGASDDQRLAARFDLGRAYEALGSFAEARTAYELVAATDDSYQDVAQRLSGLPESKPDDVAGEADGGAGFESFEDVISEAGDEGEASGETFSDLLAEASEDESDDGEDDIAGDVTAEPQPEPEPQPPPQAVTKIEPKPAAAKKKRKKISFL